MKRHLAMTSLFAATGCSLAWSMDSYDEGAATAHAKTSDGGVTNPADDGGATASGERDAGDTRVDAATSNDSGTTSDAAVSACDDTESESNDTAASANDLVPGATCGALSSTADNDYFTFTVDHAVDFSLQIGPSLRARLRETISGNVDNNYTGGAGMTKLPAGTYELRIWFYGGTLPLAYKITRGA